MTSKISLFNKGIYKATLKRFLWGSALYFLILFVFTGMAILLNGKEIGSYYFSDGRSVILRGEYLILPMLLSVVTPSVAGLMIFRFIHSKKASVFFHSLPVKREAGFISSALAGLTLLVIPIILNTAVLMIISLCGYGELFSVADCIKWLLLNFFGQFLMFSAVCFVASITGNSFAMVVLNVLVHTIVMSFVVCLSEIASVYLYGFANDNSVINKVVENSFPVKFMSLADWSGFATKAPASMFIKFSVFALAFYIASVLLYRKRRMETAEDVAGFRVLNHIFKYLITFLAALLASAIVLESDDANIFVSWCIVAIVSMVVYFGVEMFLKKTLRVWKSYKGYLVFAAAFTVLMLLFAKTSFFGFETRVPKGAEVKSVAVYEYYNREKPLTEDGEIIVRALDVQEDLIKRRTDEEKDHTYLHIEYNLKNGKIFSRRYPVEDKRLRSIMSEMYENAAYKELSEPVFDEMKEVMMAEIYSHGDVVTIYEKSKTEQLVEAIRSDVRRLSYNEIHSNGWSFRIDLQYIPKEATAYGYLYTADNEEKVFYVGATINSNFTGTINFLQENGYWDSIKIKNEGVIYIVDEYKDLPFVKIDEYYSEVVSILDPVKEEKAIKLEGNEALALFDILQHGKSEYIDEENAMQIYQLVSLENREYRDLGTISKKQTEVLFSE